MEPAKPTQLHIIYTNDDIDHGEIRLSRKAYSDWHEIQDEYKSYVASLGAWSPSEVIEYLTEEYPDLDPSSKQQVEQFIASDEITALLKWKTQEN